VNTLFPKSVATDRLVLDTRETDHIAACGSVIAFQEAKQQLKSGEWGMAPATRSAA
jgi:hypothetical protein